MIRKIRWTKRKSLVLVTVFSAFLIFFWFSLPASLFNTPTCTILEDSKGELISARIAADGQWRFPSPELIPEKFHKSIVTFEDKNFDSHWGVDWLALGKAVYQNIKAGKVVRGASTLSMQVIRLSRKNKKRTMWEKAVEIFLAIRLELSYSKDEILKLYMREAPFGGNVVGLEAASWRFYGRSPEKLSWAETATLAVLPNSPALIFPGKNERKLFVKRNRLLRKLHREGYLDKTSLGLAIKEPLPERILGIPNLTPHLLTKAEKDGLRGKRNKTTLNISLQNRVNNILKRHHPRLTANGIYNAAALVLDVEKGSVLVYSANIPGEKSKEYQYEVDLIQAHRSTGSILKPLLFAMMLNEGKMLNTSLVADIPTLIDGYAPKNYFLSYDGAVPFKNAISRSLNVPAVRLLQEYGIEKFNHNLKKLGMTTLYNPASHYGLSIILGGAEGKLFDLASIYRNMAYHLNYYGKSYSKYPGKSFPRASYIQDSVKEKTEAVSDPFLFHAGAIWLTFEAMNEVSRPEEESSWKDFVSGYKIAWKTGTSFGNRDGWAIGVTPQYVVAVWAGNADGEGRPELTGIGAAGPIMFDIFKQLKSPVWFKQPFNSMAKVKTCKQSGFRAGEYCNSTEEQWIQKEGLRSPVCPYTQRIYLDQTKKYRVTSDCEEVYKMHPVSWFVLPPSMEFYYKFRNFSYQPLPPFRAGCETNGKSLRSLEIIYPVRNSKIYVPVELDGKPGKTVFEVAHRNERTTLFWYLDNDYLGMTTEFHQLAVHPETGSHKLTVTDEKGESKEVTFEVVSENR